MLSLPLYRAASNCLPGEDNTGPCKAQIAWRRQLDDKCPSCSVIHTHACEADVYSSISWCMYSRAQHTTLHRHTKQLNDIINTRRPHTTQTHTMENAAVNADLPVPQDSDYYGTQVSLLPSLLQYPWSYKLLSVCQNSCCSYSVYLCKHLTFSLWSWFGFCELWRVFLYCRSLFLNSTSTCWVSKLETHSTSILPQRIQSSSMCTVTSDMKCQVWKAKGSNFRVLLFCTIYASSYSFFYF